MFDQLITLSINELMIFGPEMFEQKIIDKSRFILSVIGFDLHLCKFNLMNKMLNKPDLKIVKTFVYFQKHLNFF